MLIIGRGSREPEAAQELDTITKAVKSRGKYDYADFCFLEVLPPYISHAMEKCLMQNLDTLTIVPYFLYPGRKIKAVVTNVMKYQKDTQVKFLVTKSMFMHKIMVSLVESRIASVAGDISPDGTDVLVIGHGSMDPNARLSIEYIIDNLRKKYRNVELCFLEIEKPDIPDGIESCAARDPRVLVVVFYFLLAGAHVKRDVDALLQPALESSNLDDVRITAHMGTDDLMVDLILERAGEVEHAD